MVQSRSKGLHTLYSLSAAVVAFAVFWLAVGISAWVFHRRMAAPYAYVANSILTAAAILVYGMRLATKQLDLTGLGTVVALRIALAQVLGAVFAIFAFAFATHDVVLSRLIIAVYAGLLFAALSWLNLKLPSFMASLIFAGAHRQRTLVIGGMQSAAALCRVFSKRQVYGVDLVGLLTDETAPRKASPLPVLGLPSQLEQRIAETNCTQVLLLGVPSSLNQARQYVEICDRLGVRFCVVAEWGRFLGRRLTASVEYGINFLSFQREPLQCPWNRGFKRCLDLAVAAPVVIFVLPVVSLVVWACHRLQSPGPLFFLQRRNGFYGQEFVILKYRTMHVEHGEEARQASLQDKRVFPAGRWLRRLSIDELPQFANVLKGEMSLVGPRPHLPVHDENFRSHFRRYRARRLVKPGITGLAQVRGHRGETPAAVHVIRRVRSDLQYIQNWTVQMELGILARTAILLFRPSATSY